MAAMDMLQFLTSIGRDSYIDDLEIQTHVYFNPNHTPPSSSTSSSSSSSLEFSVKFNLDDSASMSLSNGQFLSFLTQGRVTSDPLVIDPDVSSTWIEASIELKRIGLHQDLLVESVIDAIKDRVPEITYYRRFYGSAVTIRVCVNIKRVTVVPMNWCDHYLQSLALSWEDYSVHPDHDEMMAIATLMRVDVEDLERLNGVSCAICLEDLQGVDDEEESSFMKLPCDHVFHGGCIRGWFKRSPFCPLCRSNVVDAD